MTVGRAFRAEQEVHDREDTAVVLVQDNLLWTKDTAQVAE